MDITAMISEAIHECVYFGLIRITELGKLSSGGVKHASKYRLTFYADKNFGPASNEWKGLSEAKVEEWKVGRRRMRQSGAPIGKALPSGKI